MANEYDRLGIDQEPGNFLIIGVLFRNMVAFVMGFLAVDQVAFESKGVVRLHGNLAFRQRTAKVVIDMGGMMADDHNYSPDSVCLGRFSKNVSLS